MSCYCCVIGVRTITYPVGDEGDVLGTCYNCHIHACGHHADRSADDAQYLCVLCVKTLLTASAFTRTPHTEYARRLLTEMGDERLMTLRGRAVIRSGQDFARSHPRLWATVANDPRWLRYRRGQGISGDVAEALDDVGIELLGLAIVICLKLEIPREAIEQILLRASEELSGEAPRLNDQ